MGWNVWQFQEKLKNYILSIYEKLQSKSIEKYNKTLTSDNKSTEVTYPLSFSVSYIFQSLS